MGVCVCCVNTSILALDSNALSGTLPSSMSLLTKLTYVLCSLTEIRARSAAVSVSGCRLLCSVLSISNTSVITGLVPDFSGATNLATLDLSSNRLLGAFPTSVLALTKLT